MIDETDQAILACLREDARMQWKEVGERVHMTGQAVAARVARLQELGVLERFTVQVDEARLGRPVHAFVTVFMSGPNHAAFQRFVQEHPAVAEAHRVSGEGCYWLRVRAADQGELTAFLDALLAHGNYRVNLSLSQVKQG